MSSNILNCELIAIYFLFFGLHIFVVCIRNKILKISLENLTRHIAIHECWLSIRYILIFFAWYSWRVLKTVADWISLVRLREIKTQICLEVFIVYQTNQIKKYTNFSNSNLAVFRQHLLRL